MGVYIRGIEMPHDCDECRLCAFIPVGDYGIHRKCLPLNANAEITIRRADCPLVPVPPHGRLIDADARVNVQLYNDEFEDFQTVNMSIDDLLDSSWIELEDDPTIIPADPAEEGE